MSIEKVTAADVEAEIESLHCFTAAEGVTGAAWLRVMDEQSGVINAFDAAPPPLALGLITICVLVLRGGFTVVASAWAVSHDDFDEEKGRVVARQKAVDQARAHLCYARRLAAISAEA